MMQDTAWLEELVLDDSLFFEQSTCDLTSEFLTDGNLDTDKSYQMCHICLKALSSVCGWREKHYVHKTSNKVVKCILCTDCFNNKNAMSVHAKVEHLNMTVKRKFFKRVSTSCKICGIQVANNNLMRHLSRCHDQRENENLLCEHCGKFFSSGEKLSLHTSNVHCRKTDLECGICNKTFTSHSVLKRHSRTFHSAESNVKFNCQYCGKIFGSGFELRRHHSKIHLKDKHLCYKCGKEFLGADNLSAHLKRHSKLKPIKHSSRQNREIKRKVCEICGKVFSSVGVLNRHIRYVHDKRYGFKCAQCKKFFHSLTEVKSHFMRVHLKVKQAECQICRKKFFDDRDLLTHIRIHLDFKPCSCPVCGMTFRVNRDLKYHQKVHGDSKLPCSECGKVFRNERLLAAHSHYHAGKCKYECASCGATFMKKDSLKVHIATHSTTKEFKCEHCHKAFFTRVHLCKHRRSHTEHYNCELCGKVCNTLANFEKHVLTHLDEYRCRDCGAHFAAVAKLQEHYKTCTARGNNTIVPLILL